MKTMNQLSLQGKILLIREDLNVPISEQGEVESSARILAALPTLEKALAEGAGVIVVSHLGRPVEGHYDEKLSLAPVAKKLSALLHRDVPLIKDWQIYSKYLASISNSPPEEGWMPQADGVVEPIVKPGNIVLLENIRFCVGEEKNSPELSKALAALCDIFVMDAFATAHRAQASTAGVTKYAKVACAGPLLEKELHAIDAILKAPKRPLLAIVGGSKVSSKLTILRSLLEKVDTLIVGGGIANTFIAASGIKVGKSLIEPDLISEARSLLKSYGDKIIYPSDYRVAEEFSETAAAKITTTVEDNEMILDIGPETLARYEKIISSVKTILWNGPVGVFEFPAFEEGTKGLAISIANSSAFSVAGGGDTLSAIDKYSLEKKLSYISTGGGAFLECIEGKILPAIAALEEKS
jgi:phosphoglycerate kinase